MYLRGMSAFEPVNPMDYAPARVNPNYGAYTPLDLTGQPTAPDYAVTQVPNQTFPSFNVATLTKPIAFGLTAKDLILIGIILYLATRRK